MHAHISEFYSEQYKKAHRHVCGVNVMLLSGEGYTLMWQEGDDQPIRIDWSPYTPFTPPTMWFHQQFNMSGKPARYPVFNAPTYRLGIRGQKDGNDAITP